MEFDEGNRWASSILLKSIYHVAERTYSLLVVMFYDCWCCVFFACVNVGTMSHQINCGRRNLINVSNVLTVVMLPVVFVCWLRLFLHLEPREALFLQYCQEQHILQYFPCLAFD